MTWNILSVDHPTPIWKKSWSQMILCILENDHFQTHPPTQIWKIPNVLFLFEPFPYRDQWIKPSKIKGTFTGSFYRLNHVSLDPYKPSLSAIQAQAQRTAFASAMTATLVRRFSVGGAGVVPGRARSVGFSREEYFLHCEGLDEGAKDQALTEVCQEPRKRP